MTAPGEDWAPRKLSHDQARQEQLTYWSTKPVAARLEAAATLTRRLLEMRGIDLAQSETDWTVTRVRREPR